MTEITNAIEGLRRSDGATFVTIAVTPHGVQRFEIPAEHVKLTDEIVERFVEALKRLAKK